VTEPRRSVLRPTVIAWAVLGSIVASFLLVVAAADGASSLAGRVGGDFPAFYGAGSIIADGDAEDLYDIERQQQAQRGLHEDEVDVLFFAYPPPVAGAYSALARLPYVPAYVLHTTLMAAALVAAFWLVRPLLPRRRPHGSVLAAAAITFLPTFMAVTLGQNSAIVVLLVAASWRYASDDRDVLAGLALGLLLFKPQYAVPLVGLHLVRGRWRVVAASGATALGWWLAGAAMLGASWTSRWLDQVAEFNAVDAEVNGRNAVSWLGIAEHALGVGSPVALVLGYGLALATAAGLVLLWWGRTDDQLGLPMAAAAAGILLISPHAMFYDAALLLVAVAALASAGRLPSRWVLAAGWLLGALHPLRDVVGLTPVGVAVVGGFAVVVRAWWRSGPELPPRPAPLDVLGPVPRPAPPREPLQRARRARRDARGHRGVAGVLRRRRLHRSG